MSKNNSCDNTQAVRSNSYYDNAQSTRSNNAFIILIVLYILLAIILSSRLY